MRLGRKLADGFAADPDAEQVRHAPEPDMASDRTDGRTAGADHTELAQPAFPAERPARV
ncbi:hypothetical protein ACFQE5_11990 [Pseudonocardia hispaniensis]|uniref:Uncharacterized protein n=1 Tax=Pseudonocardia hispaniensis TaxID=904933 RepID=A0ABW1J259_9PSEU